MYIIKVSIQIITLHTMALRAKNNNNKTQKHTNKENIITCNA